MGKLTLSFDRFTEGLATNPSRSLLKLAQIAICLIICLYSVGSFSRNALRVRRDNVAVLRNGLDFLYFYAGGALWSEGKEYDQTAFFDVMNQVNEEKAFYLQPTYYYLPPTTALFGLLAQVDYPTAYNTYWVINVSLTLVSILMLGYILSWYRPIGILEVTALCLLLNSPYARASLEIGQLGSPIFVIILGAFILSRYQRHLESAALISLMIVKYSFLPLYMGYYLLRRHFRAFVLCGALCALLCILPLVLTQRPLVETFNDWLAMIKASQGFGTPNSPSPFEIHSLEHIDFAPLIYRILNNYSPVTSLISWLVIGLLTLYSAYLIVRSSVTLKSQLLDFSLVSLLTLVTVYHRNYDVFLAFPAMIYVFIHAREQTTPAGRRNWAIFTALLFLMLTVPHYIMRQMLIENPGLQDLYVWRLIAPYQAWANAFLLSAILWLKRQQVLQEKQTAGSAVQNQPETQYS